ncbi:MAG: hypothetical protein EPO16_05230 [Dehalococcoidia bacterium]|nr:MAG: hypothetical protein EPO16_05230 [Dehalococcoidia bacterium]
MSRDARLARLSRDHHHALTLALRIQRELASAEPGDVAALARDVLRYWDEAMTPHLAVEARALLPLLAAGHDGGLALAGRAQREHRELAELTAEIRRADPAKRAEALLRLGAALSALIRWEERDLMEWAQSHLDGAALEHLAEAVAKSLPAQAVPCPVPHLP